jgi:hypothetical protein
MEEEKGFIKYFIIIIIILIVAFLSQQAYTRGIGKTLISNATSQAQAYMAKGSSWVVSNVYSKISGEVQKREEAIKTDVTQEKNKVSENIGKKISNYFSGVSNSVLHPGNNTCQTVPDSTSAK